MAYMAITNSSPSTNHYASSQRPASHSSTSLAYRYSKYPTSSSSSTSRSEVYGRRKPLNQISYVPSINSTSLSTSTTSAWNYTAPASHPVTSDEPQHQHTILAQWCSLYGWPGEPTTGSNNHTGSNYCHPLPISSQPLQTAQHVQYLAPMYATSNAFDCDDENDDYRSADFASPYNNNNNNNSAARVQFETWSGRTAAAAAARIKHQKRIVVTAAQRNEPHYTAFYSPEHLSQDNSKPPVHRNTSSAQSKLHYDGKHEINDDCDEDDPLYITQYEDGDRRHYGTTRRSSHSRPPPVEIGLKPTNNSPKNGSSCNTIYRSQSQRNDFQSLQALPSGNVQRRTTASSSVIESGRNSAKNEPVYYADPSCFHHHHHHRFRPSTRSDDVEQLLPTRLAESSASSSTKLSSSSNGSNGSKSGSIVGESVKKSNSFKRWQRKASLNTTKPVIGTVVERKASTVCNNSSSSAALPPRDTSRNNNSAQKYQHTATAFVGKDSATTVASPPKGIGVGTMVSSIKLRLLGGGSSLSSSSKLPPPARRAVALAESKPKLDSSCHELPSSPPTTVLVTQPKKAHLQTQKRQQASGYQTPNSIMSASSNANGYAAGSVEKLTEIRTPAKHDNNCNKNDDGFFAQSRKPKVNHLHNNTTAPQEDQHSHNNSNSNRPLLGSEGCSSSNKHNNHHSSFCYNGRVAYEHNNKTEKSNDAKNSESSSYLLPVITQKIPRQLCERTTKTADNYNAACSLTKHFSRKDNKDNASLRTVGVVDDDEEDNSVVHRGQKPQKKIISNPFPEAVAAANGGELTKTLLAPDEQTAANTSSSTKCANNSSTIAPAVAEATGTVTKVFPPQVRTSAPATRTCSNSSVNNSKRKNHTNTTECTAANAAATIVRHQSIPARTPTPSPHMVLVTETTKRRASLFGASTTTDDTPMQAKTNNSKAHFLTLRVKSTVCRQQQHDDRRGVERNDTPTPPTLVVPSSSLLLSSSSNRFVSASFSAKNNKLINGNNHRTLHRRDVIPPFSQQQQLEKTYIDSRSAVLVSPASSLEGDSNSIINGEISAACDDSTLRRRSAVTSANRCESFLSNSRPASTELREKLDDVFRDCNTLESYPSYSNSRDRAVVETPHNREIGSHETAHEVRMKSLKHMLRMNSGGDNNNVNSTSSNNRCLKTSRSNSLAVTSSNLKPASLYQVPVLFSTDYYTPIVVTPHASMSSDSPPSVSNYHNQNQGPPAEYNIYSAATSLSSASDNTSSHYNSSIATHSYIQNQHDGIGQVYSSIHYMTPSQPYHVRSASGAHQQSVVPSRSVDAEVAANHLPPPPPPLSPSVIRRAAPPPSIQPPAASGSITGNISRRASEHLNLSQLNKLNNVVAATAARRRRESLVDANINYLPTVPDENYQQETQREITASPMTRPASAIDQLPVNLPLSPTSKVQTDQEPGKTVCVRKKPNLGDVNLDMTVANAAPHSSRAGSQSLRNRADSEVLDADSQWKQSEESDLHMGQEDRHDANFAGLPVITHTTVGLSLVPPPPPLRAALQTEPESSSNWAPAVPCKQNAARHTQLFCRQQALRRAGPTNNQQQSTQAREQPLIMIRKPRMRTVSSDRGDSRLRRLSVFPTSEYASPAKCNVSPRTSVEPAVVYTSHAIEAGEQQTPALLLPEGALHELPRRLSFQRETDPVTIPAGIKSSSTTTTSDSSEYGGGNSFEADSNGRENTLVVPPFAHHPRPLSQLPSLSVPSASSLSNFADQISTTNDHRSTSPDQNSFNTQCSSIASAAVDYDSDSVRGQLVHEIIQNERDYVKNLRDIVEGYLYKCRERSDMFSKGRIELIFGNIEQVYEFQSELLSSLEQSLSEQMSKTKSANIGRRLSSGLSKAREERSKNLPVPNHDTAADRLTSDTNLEAAFSANQQHTDLNADIPSNEDDALANASVPSAPPSNECLRDAEIGHWFLMHQQGFAELYTEYCINHSQACAELRQLLQITQYRYFFEACRRLRDMIDIPLSGFLLQPVQKICKYPLQLQELLKCTSPLHADHDSVKLALRAMIQTTTLVNERKRRLECLEKIALFQHTVQQWEGEDLLERSSTLLHHGELQRVGGQSSSWNKDYHFFLFDHQLLYCKRDMLKRFLVYKSRFDLNQCDVETLPAAQNDSNVKYGFRIRCRKTTLSSQWFVLGAKTAEDRTKWLKAFSDERRIVSEDQFHKFYIQPRYRLSAIEQAQKILLSNRGKKLTYRDALKDLEDHRASTLTHAKRSRSLSFPSRIKSAGDLHDLATKNNNNVAYWAALVDPTSPDQNSQQFEQYT